MKLTSQTLAEMNKLTAVLVTLIVLLQFRLWFGDGNVFELHRLNTQIEELRREADKKRERNAALEAEVTDLKQGSEAIEERARQDLGMIKPGEVYFQVNDGRHPEVSTAPTPDKPTREPVASKHKPHPSAKPPASAHP